VRPTTLAGAAGVVVVGALVPLAVLLLAGDGGGRVGWIVVAGAAACASGLAFGTTRRVLPTLVPAAVAAVALTVAATAREEEEPVRERALPAARVAVAGEQERSRPDARVTKKPRTRRTGARQFVSRYYALLEAGRYEEAWSRLSAAGQAQTRDFEAWRAGYATTVSQRVEDLRTDPGGVVRYVLVAVDRTPCGTTTERRFAIRWRVVRTGRTTTATSLSGVKLAGLDPIAAC